MSFESVHPHRHGEQASIQSDLDKLIGSSPQAWGTVERLLKDCADELSLNIAYCKNAPTIKNRAWQLHDKIRNVIGED